MARHWAKQTSLHHTAQGVLMGNTSSPPPLSLLPAATPISTTTRFLIQAPFLWTVTKILCNVFTQGGVRAGAWLYSNHRGPQPCLQKERRRAKTDDPVAWGPGLKTEPKSRAQGSSFPGVHHTEAARRRCYPGGLFTRLGESCLHREGGGSAVWLFSG